ncbi:MAG: glycosyltransferase family 4 protein [Candidatus Rokubacteria bacterium]|nr:glycosyltransferase family 4 protein [Candidatus Rokubacteria bacterium]
MQISFLCPHLRIAGGVRAILTYADRLARRGHDVTVLVPAKSRVRALVRSARGQGPAWIPDFRPRVRWVGAWRAADLAGADVAVATAWQSAPIVAASSARATFYLVQHYESLYHGDAARVDATYRLPLRKIVISTWLGDIMRERFASDAEVLVTPVDPALFHRVDVAPRTPRPRVLMLHHGYAWKGVADGLDAVARVKLRVPSLHLVGFGVKPPKEALPYDEFHPNPPQERLAELYSGSDVYLCPSWDEGLGMPSMEAMACGAALVTYDNGGSRDYARDGDTAFVAPRRDVAALAARLEQAATDDLVRGTIAARGRAHVTRAFDWERAVARMEAIFAEASSLAIGRPR